MNETDRKMKDNSIKSPLNKNYQGKDLTLRKIGKMKLSKKEQKIYKITKDMNNIKNEKENYTEEEYAIDEN